MPGRPAAALIGRVGDGNDLFFIGDDEGPIRVRSGGRLFLGINDDMLNGQFGIVSGDRVLLRWAADGFPLH